MIIFNVHLNDLLGPLMVLQFFGLGFLAMAAYYYVDYQMSRGKKVES